MDTLVARLESLVARMGGSEDDGEGTPVALSEYNSYFSTHVQPFIDACNKFDDTKQLGAWTDQAFKHLGVVIEMACKCKKPDMQAFMAKLGPIVELFDKSGNPDKSKSTFPQEKAFAEALQGLNWVCADLPRPVVNGCLESADFYLNKALVAAKDLEDPAKTDRRKFVSTMKTMLKELEGYVVAFHKTGLAWSFKGGDLANFKPGQSAPKLESKEASVEDRLGACVVALEAHAAQMAAGDDDGEGDAPSVIAWQELHDECIKPFIETCGKVEHCKQVAKWATKAFDHMIRVIRASKECTKPSPQEFMAFLAPVVEVITESGNPDKRDTAFPFEKSFSEGIQSLNWVMIDLPRPFVAGQLEAADFYLNKCLTYGKDLEDPTKTEVRNYVKQFKAFMTKMADYTKEFYKTGLTWNPKGKSIKDLAAPAASAAPAAAKAAPKAAAKKAPAAKKAEVFGDGVIDTKQQDKIFVERYKYKTNPGTPIEIVSPGNTTGVFIGNCKNATFVLKGKFKNLTVANCERCGIVVDDVVTIIEVISCKKVQMQSALKCGSFQLDKSVETTLFLADESMKTGVVILSSMSSSSNVVVSDGDDSKEYGLPDQMSHTFKRGQEPKHAIILAESGL